MMLLPEDLERVREVKKYVEDHYRDHITFALLAQQFIISERKLSADFKSTYGITIYNFIIEVRLEKAKKLLEQTYIPVKTIAGLVGYEKSNLYKNFKRFTGMAPQDWRQRAMQAQKTVNG
jgi:transcriptional regulator GlxA family with amidase domain